MPIPLTFIRAAETWLPGGDGSELVAAPNSFDSGRRLEALGRTQGFRRGEGLPGRAWAEGRPVLMRELDASGFQRAGAAEAAGVTCAIAVPVFLSGSLKAVLVLFCGHLAGRPGALELWHAGDSVGGAITLVDGAYGESSAEFEAASRDIVLDRGDGLPGTAWQAGDLVFVDDLSAGSRRFRRAEQAVGAGMKRGLAIPFGSSGVGGYVLAVLAGADLPLALGVERWQADTARTKLTRTLSFSERHGGRNAAPAEMSLPADRWVQGGAVAAAFATGVPMIVDCRAEEAGPVAATASKLGASALVVIPVVWGGSVVRSVAVLYL